MDQKLHVHFMGVGGSGMAPVAILSKHLGYTVSGCDMSSEGYYSDELHKNNINIQSGHSEKHLKEADILAVSPAIFDLNPDHPEILEGKRRNILMTWQEFTGKYLQKDKFVIAVAGTHGKSTTTVLMGAALEAGGLDPLVEAGTIYKPWGGGYRIGNSKYFVCEADEFNNNFLNFSPSIAVINNIEMDHPEFFKDFSQMKASFKAFIKNMQSPKILIVNEESSGIRELLSEMRDYIHSSGIKVIGYYLKDRFDFPFAVEYRGEILSCNSENTEFKLIGSDFTEVFNLGLIGTHNVSNSLGVLAACLELGLGKDALKSAFQNFKGIGRRSEFIGEAQGVKFFDDYAHHPTAVAAILDSFRSIYPGRTLWAIIEPHQISRIKLFFNEFAAALSKADKIVVTKIFVGREKYKNIEPPDMNLFVEKIGSSKAKYLEDTDSVVNYVIENAAAGDVLVVFGAGQSYKLTQKIIDAMGKEEGRD